MLLRKPEVNAVFRLRAVFEKKGRAKYISHLDLNRCMLRLFRRSGLPVWYTEGFNPHPYFSFALALSLGYESTCEILDFALTEEIPPETVMNKLNAVMPEGMKISEVSEPVMKITQIAKAVYEIELCHTDPDLLYEKIEDFLSMEKIQVEKKTKKTVTNIDLKPFLEVISIKKEAESVTVELILPAGTQTNINPSLFVGALSDFIPFAFDVGRICRTGILCENGEKFA